MHTSQFRDEDGEVWYAHYNGDYFGEVHIETSHIDVRIPFGLMKELVGQSLIDKMVEELEGMDGAEFLDSIGR